MKELILINLFLLYILMTGLICRQIFNLLFNPKFLTIFFIELLHLLVK